MYPSDKQGGQKKPQNEVDEDENYSFETDPALWDDFVSQYGEYMPHYDQYYQQDVSYMHPVFEPGHEDQHTLYEHHESPLYGFSTVERYPGHAQTHEEPSHDHAFAHEEHSDH